MTARSAGLRRRPSNRSITGPFRTGRWFSASPAWRRPPPRTSAQRWILRPLAYADSRCSGLNPGVGWTHPLCGRCPSDAARRTVLLVSAEAASARTLAALRRARAHQETARRALRPLGLVAVALATGATFRTDPRPGWHGTGLGHLRLSRRACAHVRPPRALSVHPHGPPPAAYGGDCGPARQFAGPGVAAAARRRVRRAVRRRRAAGPTDAQPGRPVADRRRVRHPRPDLDRGLAPVGRVRPAPGRGACRLLHRRRSGPTARRGQPAGRTPAARAGGEPRHAGAGRCHGRAAATCPRDARRARPLAVGARCQLQGARILAAEHTG